MGSTIQTHDPVGMTPQRSLYRRLLGPAADQLDDRVADLHCSTRDVRATGHLRVRRGPTVAARLVAALLRLPRAGPQVPTHLSIIRRPAGEHWTRVFGDNSPVCSWQRADSRGRLVERFGPLRLTFLLDADGCTLRFHQQDCQVVAGLRLPMPTALAPQVDATVRPGPARDQVSVSVRITCALTGPLLTYAGVMSIEENRS